MIKRETGQDVRLIKGSGGVFEVTVGGKLVYSKRAVGSFPDEGELLQDIKAEL